VWARVVMDFALAHHERRLARDHLLRSLTPLYLGRVAAFLREARRASANGTAGLLDQIGRAFEAEKEDLAARWR
jgi:glucosylglycerate synthase